MTNRTTLAGLALTFAVPIAAAALNNASTIRQAGALANGGQSALRVGYDGDVCKGPCADEPWAPNALKTNALKTALSRTSRPPLAAEIPTPENDAPKASTPPINAAAPFGALLGSLIGGLGGMFLAKRL